MIRGRQGIVSHRDVNKNAVTVFYRVEHHETPKATVNAIVFELELASIFSERNLPFMQTVLKLEHLTLQNNQGFKIYF